MPNVYDLAAFILRDRGEITTFKLHKLAYYCQAWSLVWDEQPLFPERIEAWANGPVVPVLYEGHKGAYTIRKCSRGNPDVFDKKQRATIHSVLKFYGGKSSQWLKDLTHNEKPWRDARRGLGPSDRGNRVITHSSMADYYSSLD